LGAGREPLVVLEVEEGEAQPATTVAAPNRPATMHAIVARRGVIAFIRRPYGSLSVEAR
jgi:hypothetical protein